MYDFYKNKISDKTLRQVFCKLNVLYNKIPKTSGCLENIRKENGCNCWCCNDQNPQLMFCEFINIWNYLINNESQEKINKIVIKAVKNYLCNSPIKGCIMLNNSEKKCSIHNKRPLNCRLYGQTPNEEFVSRLNRLRIQYKNCIGAKFKDQCNLLQVSKKLSKEDTDSFQYELQKIEQYIGIDKNKINDDDNGSYRQFHDHILLKVFGEKFLNDITDLKINGNLEQKENYIKFISNKLKVYEL